MRTFLKLLQNLSGAIGQLGRLEYGLILCRQQCITACLREKYLYGHRRICRCVKRLRRSLERILFGFLVVFHKRLHSADNVDEETDRDGKAYAENDHSDYYVSWHTSWSPAPRPRIVGLQPLSN